METQQILNSQNNLEKEECNWRETIFPISGYNAKLRSSRLYVTGTKTKKYGQTEQVESPEIGSNTYGNFIFHKRGKNIQWEKTVSSTSGAGQTSQPCVKE